MLETIYEVDENTIFDDETSKSTDYINRSRLPYYICWSIIAGSFLLISVLIVISVNSLNLSNNSINEISGGNIPLSSDEKLELSTKIIDHLGIFSQQINQQLYLRSNKITFFTTQTSNSLTEDPNEIDILWIYSHLKYPHYCIRNKRCKENFNLKLEKSFIKLSKFLSTIQLESYQDRQFQLDYCTLIDNSTTATLVSLLSIRVRNQSEFESVSSFNRIICDNIDENVFLSELVDNTLKYNDFVTTTAISIIIDNQKIARKIDFNNNSSEKDEATDLICTNPNDCSTHTNNNKETIQYSNNVTTQLFNI